MTWDEAAGVRLVTVHQVLTADVSSQACCQLSAERKASLPLRIVSLMGTLSWAQGMF